MTRLCITPGCGHKRYAHGLCQAEYMRLRHHGTTELLTYEERSEINRLNGLASWEAKKKTGDVHMAACDGKRGRRTFFEELADDKAREAATAAKRKKRGPRNASGPVATVLGGGESGRRAGQGGSQDDN